MREHASKHWWKYHDEATWSTVRRCSGARFNPERVVMSKIPIDVLLCPKKFHGTKYDIRGYTFKTRNELGLVEPPPRKEEDSVPGSLMYNYIYTRDADGRHVRSSGGSLYVQVPKVICAVDMCRCRRAVSRARSSFEFGAGPPHVIGTISGPQP